MQKHIRALVILSLCSNAYAGYYSQFHQGVFYKYAVNLGMPNTQSAVDAMRALGGGLNKLALQKTGKKCLNDKGETFTFISTNDSTGVVSSIFDSIKAAKYTILDATKNSPYPVFVSQKGSQKIISTIFSAYDYNYNEHIVLASCRFQ